MSTFMARIHVSWVTFQYRISPLPSQEHRRSVFFGWKSNDVTWKLCPLKVCRENPGCKTFQHKQYCTTCKCKQKRKIQGKASNTDSIFYPLYWCIDLRCSQQKKYLYANSFMTWLYLVTFSAMGTIWISCDHITASTNTQTSTSLLVYREQKHNCNVAVEGIIAVQHNIHKPIKYK